MTDLRNTLWLKTNVIELAVFPQLPSFCGVAACCGALGAMLDRRVTQQELHERYGVARYTKLHASSDTHPDTFAGLQRSGRGFSNWDVIRLCNSVLLDEGREPDAMVLCGQDFVRELSERKCISGILNFLREDSCQVIVHVPGHYVLFAGGVEWLESETGDGHVYLLFADSSRRFGPIRSLALSHLFSLAREDERYGFVFVSDHRIPRSLFQTQTDEMVPPEVIEHQRFARIGKS